MSWNVHFATGPEKFIGRYDKHLRDRFFAAFNKLAESPFLYLEHYEGQGYKFRIGEYRAIIYVEHETQTLLVHEFAHRKNIYK